MSKRHNGQGFNCPCSPCKKSWREIGRNLQPAVVPLGRPKLSDENKIVFRKWINRSDKKPEKDGHYLVFDEIMMVASFYVDTGSFWILDGGDCYEIFPTHWRELPEEPKD